MLVLADGRLSALDAPQHHSLHVRRYSACRRRRCTCRGKSARSTTPRTPRPSASPSPATPPPAAPSPPPPLPRSTAPQARTALLRPPTRPRRGAPARPSPPPPPPPPPETALARRCRGGTPTRRTRRCWRRRCTTPAWPLAQVRCSLRALLWHLGQISTPTILRVPKARTRLCSAHLRPTASRMRRRAVLVGLGL